jgi:hypothetical protein
MTTENIDHGCAIHPGTDGVEVLLRGDGWTVEHFRLWADEPTRLMCKLGPYHTAGYARLVEGEYRRKWGP